MTLNSRGDAVSLSYTPLVSPLAPRCADLTPLDEAPTFKSTISFETANPGMTIPTLLPQTKPPPGLKFFARAQGAKDIPGLKTEAEQGPTSFLMKYWYIFLPLFIVTMMGGGGEPPPAAQDDPPQRTGAAPRAKVAATSAAASPDGRARRGKRG